MILIFNPRSAKSKPRIPNSVLQVAASIDADYEWVIVDGNREEDPWPVIKKHLDSGKVKYFCATVMPGPQLSQLVPIAQKSRELYPEVVNIWGGYFASNQYKVCIESPWVDYIISGPGDNAFPALIRWLETGEGELREIRNLIYKENGEIVKTAKEDLLNQDALPPLPYAKLHSSYPIEGYLGRTFLGKRTIAYHSSVGCPFTCSFCAVVPIYQARWKGKSAENIFKDILYLKEQHGGDAIEFHDNNFFVSEKRSVAFSKLMKGQGISWWGEGRIDTLDKYKDESLALMAEAGLKMVFFGAESGNDGILKQMDKGGKQTGEQIKSFAGRLRKFGIVPEYSFVLGTPADSPEKVMAQIDEEIRFIKEVKAINPDTEIIIYVYSPVPTEGSELYEAVKSAGFSFPEKLEDWLRPEWENFDLRKNPLTPWLTPAMVDRIKNFETVLNARYPTKSDVKLSNFQIRVMKTLAAPRYKMNLWRSPYELKALQRYWLRYRQPEIEGM